MVILMVTDITSRNSVLLFSDSSLTGSRQVSLPGMTSRKKKSSLADRPLRFL
jgi:manganese-dependent inorganic pyrophosphatase